MVRLDVAAVDDPFDDRGRGGAEGVLQPPKTEADYEQSIRETQRRARQMNVVGGTGAPKKTRRTEQAMMALPKSLGEVEEGDCAPMHPTAPS